jgi:hypothetical protein
MLKHWISKMRPATEAAPAPDPQRVADLPAPKPSIVTKALVAVGLKPEVNHELIEWSWDSEKGKPVARFVNGAPEEPEGIRRRQVYHSHFRDRAEPPQLNAWIFPRGFSRGRRSWWD